MPRSINDADSARIAGLTEARFGGAGEHRGIGDMQFADLAMPGRNASIRGCIKSFRSTTIGSLLLRTMLLSGTSYYPARQIQQLGQTKYPETQALLKVQGVGHITALTFVLTLGNKERFGRSRDVAAISVCDRDAVSLANVIRNSTSQKPATPQPRHRTPPAWMILCT